MDGYVKLPRLSFRQAVSECFHKYATFSGRARRSEFWWWTLFMAIISVLLRILPIVGVILWIITLLPSLAVFWRRMHDIGKNGWWILLSLLPVVGGIILLVWECRDSEREENKYGPSPKYSKEEWVSQEE